MASSDAMSSGAIRIGMLVTRATARAAASETGPPRRCRRSRWAVSKSRAPTSNASQCASASPAAPPQIRAAVCSVPGTSSLGIATRAASSVMET